MARVLPNKVGRVMCTGCVSVNAYSQHWPCLFPQHAPGPKHLRPIVLEQWQARIGLELHPRMLLRGLIHSDGYRGMNRIKGGAYTYPRYMFSIGRPTFVTYLPRHAIGSVFMRPNAEDGSCQSPAAMMWR